METWPSPPDLCGGLLIAWVFGAVLGCRRVPLSPKMPPCGPHKNQWRQKLRRVDERACFVSISERTLLHPRGQSFGTVWLPYSPPGSPESGVSLGHMDLPPPRRITDIPESEPLRDRCDAMPGSEVSTQVDTRFPLSDRLTRIRGIRHGSIRLGSSQKRRPWDIFRIDNNLRGRSDWLI